MMALSPLAKTWLIDIDGTIFKHNGYLDENEVLLPGVAAFFQMIPRDDVIILLTARTEKFREATISALIFHKIRYNIIIFSLPVGERIVINDCKPSGLEMAYAVNLVRDQGLCNVEFKIVEN